MAWFRGPGEFEVRRVITFDGYFLFSGRATYCHSLIHPHLWRVTCQARDGAGGKLETISFNVTGRMLQEMIGEVGDP